MTVVDNLDRASTIGGVSRIVNVMAGTGRVYCRNSAVNFLDISGKTPVPGIDAIVGGLVLLLGFDLLAFFFLVVVGVILIVVAVVFLIYCAVEGIQWGNESAKEIQKLKKIQIDSSGIDEEERAGLGMLEEMRQSRNYSAQRKFMANCIWCLIWSLCVSICGQVISKDQCVWSASSEMKAS